MLLFCSYFRVARTKEVETMKESKTRESKALSAMFSSWFFFSQLPALTGGKQSHSKELQEKDQHIQVCRSAQNLSLFPLSSLFTDFLQEKRKKEILQHQRFLQEWLCFSPLRAASWEKKNKTKTLQIRLYSFLFCSPSLSLFLWF